MCVSKCARLTKLLLPAFGSWYLLLLEVLQFPVEVG